MSSPVFSAKHWFSHCCSPLEFSVDSQLCGMFSRQSKCHPSLLQVGRRDYFEMVMTIVSRRLPPRAGLCSSHFLFDSEETGGKLRDHANPQALRHGLSHGHPLMELYSRSWTWLCGPCMYLPSIISAQPLLWGQLSLPISPTLELIWMQRRAPHIQVPLLPRHLKSLWEGCTCP